MQPHYLIKRGSRAGIRTANDSTPEPEPVADQTVDETTDSRSGTVPPLTGPGVADITRGAILQPAQSTAGPPDTTPVTVPAGPVSDARLFSINIELGYKSTTVTTAAGSAEPASVTSGTRPVPRTAGDFLYTLLGNDQSEHSLQIDRASPPAIYYSTSVGAPLSLFSCYIIDSFGPSSNEQSHHRRYKWHIIVLRDGSDIIQFKYHSNFNPRVHSQLPTMPMSHHQPIATSPRFLANIFRRSKDRRFATRVHRVSALSNGHLMRIVRLTRHRSLTRRSDNSIEQFSFTTGPIRNMFSSNTVIRHGFQGVISKRPLSIIPSDRISSSVNLTRRNPMRSKRRQRATVQAYQVTRHMGLLGVFQVRQHHQFRYNVHQLFR